MSNLNKAYTKIHLAKSRIKNLSDKSFLNDKAALIETNSILKELLTSLKEINVFVEGKDGEILGCVAIVLVNSRKKFTYLPSPGGCMPPTYETISISEIMNILSGE